MSKLCEMVHMRIGAHIPQLHINACKGTKICADNQIVKYNLTNLYMNAATL